MPLGNVLYSNGSATQYSAFAILPYVGATTPHSPSVIDWNRDSADFYVFTTNSTSSGTVTSFSRKFFADTATPFSPCS